MRPFWPRIRGPISGAGRAPCACASPAPLKQIATTAQASSHTGISRSRADVASQVRYSLGGSATAGTNTGTGGALTDTEANAWYCRVADRWMMES